MISLQMAEVVAGEPEIRNLNPVLKLQTGTQMFVLSPANPQGAHQQEADGRKSLDSNSDTWIWDAGINSVILIIVQSEHVYPMFSCGVLLCCIPVCSSTDQ